MQSDPATISAQAEIARIAAFAKGGVGVAARHLGSGRILEYEADHFYPLASTVKVPLALTVLAAVDRGELALSDLIAVEDAEMNPSGPLGTELLHPGAALSVHNLLEPMITRSDNTATDVLFRTVGGPAGVMHYLAELGVDGIRTSRTVRELLCVLYGIEPPGPAMSVRDVLQAMPADAVTAARARASAPNSAYSDDLRDQATPRAMVELLRRLALAEGVSPAARDVLLPIMRRTSTGVRRIEGRLPQEVPVANKTGSASGTTNDVGLVTLPASRGTVAMAIYVKASPLPAAEREDVIADIARLIYDFYVITTPPAA